MPYLVDGSNLGGALGGARGARDAAAVVRWLQEWARGRGRVVAIFDGDDPAATAARYGALEIRSSGVGRTADDEIVRLVALEGRGRSAKNWTVVTDDRTLARRCRDLGARVEGVAALAARVESARTGSAGAGPDAAHDKPATHAEELAHWRKVFGVDS